MHPNNFSEFVFAKTSKFSDSTALIFENQTLTYGQIAQRSRSAAGYFSKILEAKQQVIIMMDDCFEWPCVFYGLVLHGCLPIILNSKTPQDKVHDILSKINVKKIICQRDKLPWLDQQQCLYLDEIDFDHAPITQVYNFADDEDMAWFSTSGTTGKPKLVRHLHGSFVRTLDWSWTLELDASTVLLCLAKMSTVLGFGLKISVGPVSGCTNVIASESNVKSGFWKLINRHQVTHLITLPAMLNQLINKKDLVLGTHLRIVMSSSEPLPLEFERRFYAKFGFNIVNTYGATETLWMLVKNFSTDAPPGTLGRALDYVTAKVLDEYGNPCLPNQPGNLYCKIETVSPGYYDDQEATDYLLPTGLTDSVLPGTWYNSRDVVYQDDAGYLHYINRTDHRVKISGYWAAASEIENYILTFLDVQDCVVVFEKDDQDLNTSHAYIVQSNTVSMDEQRVRATMLQNLPSHLVPKKVTFVDSIPKLPSGKVMRNANLLHQYVTQPDFA